MKYTAINRHFRFMAFLVLLLALGCRPDGRKAKVIAGDDDLSSGTIHISVDESFKPVIDSQIKVFENQFPKARIIAHYKPEADCLKDLVNDSIRMVIVTRGLSEEEVNYYRDTLEFPPIFGEIASDAIAVVTNNSNKDSVFSMADIRGMLMGATGYPYELVMDGLSATSTVRYLIDTVLKGQTFKGKVVAARSSEGVIDYVAGKPQSIGFVGVSWIGNHEDSAQLSFQQRVRIAALQCANCDEETYVRPYQANIALKRYPMVRGLYYILKENYAGLGKGFTNFLTHEKGQLIFKRAYLVPERMALKVRRVNMSE
jgi:phosphate transport system substrate-binding protein